MVKILIIDDEPNIRDLLVALLSRKGYQVVLSENGAEGLNRFLRERPDVVVLDLTMPEIDGLTVLREIRSLHPNQPVLILTGTGTPYDEQQVRALGVTEYVDKECSLEVFDDALERLLKGRS